jgi:16S rRNA (uracil1498-N3)-methyltransferase
MFNFFADESARQGGYFYISGSDYNHIRNVLRMKEGEEFLVSSGGISSLCRLDRFNGDSAVAEIIEENYQSTDLPIEIYLFQGLPKSDKMELIIQKAVELGVHAIIPTQMQRCVVKLDDKKKKSKTQRWQAIAESAAKQSKRSAVPEVYDCVSYNEALDMAKDLDVLMVPYECKDGMGSTRMALSQIKEGSKVGIIIGPEGGFEENEVEKAMAIGGESISLGKRILRTETAAITAVGMVMLYSEMNLGGDKE